MHVNKKNPFQCLTKHLKQGCFKGLLKSSPFIYAQIISSYVIFNPIFLKIHACTNNVGLRVLKQNYDLA